MPYSFLCKMVCFSGVLFIGLHTTTRAQNGDSIISLLQSIHQSVTNAPCYYNSRPVISNRAMNLFLADKTGYLSESTDLSLYTNYLTLNAADGKLTINHNFQKAKGTDSPIKTLPSIGIWGRLTGSYIATSLDKSHETEMGITVGYKWLGKVKTKADECKKPDTKKQTMDALRTAALYKLTGEIKRQAADFETSLSGLQAADLPGQNMDSAKALMRNYFYTQLQLKYEKTFAEQQAVTLTETKNFTLITTHYTGITLSIPLFLPHYTQGTSLTTPLKDRHPFDFGIQLSHTWLWESSKAGRLFLKGSGEAFLNNSKWSYGLQSFTQSDYRGAGGRDTVYLTGRPDKFIFIGNYQSFITPLVKGQVVYFPPGSHLGIQFSAEQNFGKFHPFNCIAGVPVVLINRQKTPAANFNFSILFADVFHSLPAQKNRQSTSFYISAGIPFSRLMF